MRDFINPRRSKSLMPRGGRMSMRPQLRVRQKMAWRFGGIITLLVAFGLIIYFQFSTPESTYSSPASGDYVAVKSGLWSSDATWKTFNGTGWVGPGPGHYPTSSNGVIEIPSGDTVTVSASVTVDQLQVDSGAVLVISSGVTLTVIHNSGTDLTVNGTLTATGGVTLSSSAAVVVNGTMTEAASFIIGASCPVTINGSFTGTSTGSVSLGSSASITINGTYTSAASLGIASGATVTINSGGVYGQTGTVSNSGTIKYNSGSTYQLTTNGGTIPVMTWPAGTTLLITGVTTTVPSNLNQTFNNVIWNCPNQTAKLDLNGKLSVLSGDLNIASTGTGAIDIGSGNATLAVGGNFNLSGGKVFLGTTHANTLTVTGDFNETGGDFHFIDSTGGGDGGMIVTVNGNFNLSNGIFNVSSNNTNANQDGVTTWNMLGNFNMTGGYIMETASQTSATVGFCKVYFKKSGTQTFTKSGGTISGTLNFTVNSAAIVDMETNILDGSNGTFTLSSGGGVILGDPNGITTSGASGNVQVTGTRSYNTGADYTYNGSVVQVTGNGLPATVHNLTVNNDTLVTLTNNVTVSNVLTLAYGSLGTGADTVKVSNTASAAIVGHCDSSYVIGNLQRSVSSSGSYDFPLGTSTYYELITVTTSSAGGISNMTGQYTTSNPAPTGLPSAFLYNGKSYSTPLDNGYWTITPNATLSSGSYGVSVNCQGQTNSTSIDSTDYIIMKRHDVASAWAFNGTPAFSSSGIKNGWFRNGKYFSQISTARSGNSGNSSVSASTSQYKITSVITGLTTFSHFAGVMGGITGLPIELLYFNAKLVSDYVDLSWSTASEINNDYFTVERSADGINFEEVFRKPGAGNSTVTLNYSGIDPNPIMGRISYYRLKQTDYDGKYAYSQIRPVGLNNLGDQQIKIATIGPVPFSTDFTVNYSVAAKGQVQIMIFNASGQLYYKEATDADKGLNTWSYYDNVGLPAGIYIVNLISNGEVETKKIIKQ